ncbi:hypothetical protein D3C72_1801020 [compost metagenome]
MFLTVTYLKLPENSDLIYFGRVNRAQTFENLLRKTVKGDDCYQLSTAVVKYGSMYKSHHNANQVLSFCLSHLPEQFDPNDRQTRYLKFLHNWLTVR